MPRGKNSAQTSARQINYGSRRQNISNDLQPKGKNLNRKPRAAEKNCREKQSEKYIKIINIVNMRRY